MSSSKRLGASFSVLSASITSLIGASAATACPMHWATMGNYTPVADSVFETAAFSEEAAPSYATIGAWKLNLTGTVGHSSNTTINNLIDMVSSDVQNVYYDTSFVYIKGTDIPSHDLGPFTGNPAYPANANRTSRLPRTPVVATTKTAVGLGSVGVMVNGGLFFNPQDAMSYNNQNLWHQNANVFEASSFDVGPGHPAPNMGSTTTPQAGTYHYHGAPIALLNQIDPGNTGQHHSPIVGYAWDGFPIYGPYGYTNPADSSSAIKKVTSSYQVRDGLLASGTRDKTSDTGTTLATNLRGPSVASVAAGSYIEDYEYVSGLGDLDQYNMRFTVTPEYPQGTYAYFLTLNSAGTSVYPYIIGPQYFGVVDTSNTGPTGGTTTIPAAATKLVAGDADADGVVDFDDLLMIAQHYGTSGVTQWSDGDFNRDASINFTDLLLLAQNYTPAVTGSFSGDWAVALSLVPEPASIAGLLLPSLVLARRHREVRA